MTNFYMKIQLRGLPMERMPVIPNIDKESSTVRMFAVFLLMTKDILMPT